MGEGEGEPVHLPLPEYYGQDDTAKPRRYIRLDQMPVSLLARTIRERIEYGNTN